MIHHSPPFWIMRHLVGEASPELEHLRAGAALWRPKRQPKIFGDKVISALEEPTRSVTGCGPWRRLPATCPPTPVRMPATRAATSSRQGTGPACCVATAPARTRTGYAVRTEQQDPREVRPRITGRDLPVTPMLIHGSGFCRVGQVPLRSPHPPYGFSASVIGRGEQWPYPQGRRWTSVP